MHVLGILKWIVIKFWFIIIPVVFIILWKIYRKDIKNERVVRWILISMLVLTGLTIMVVLTSFERESELIPTMIKDGKMIPSRIESVE